MIWVSFILITLGVLFSIYLAVWIMRKSYHISGLFFLAYSVLLINLYVDPMLGVHQFLSQFSLLLGPLLYLSIADDESHNYKFNYYHFIPFIIAIATSLFFDVLGFESDGAHQIVLSPAIRTIHGLIYVLLSAFEVRNSKWKKSIVIAIIPLFVIIYVQDFNLITSFVSSLAMPISVVLFGILCTQLVKKGENKTLALKKSIEQEIEEEQERKLLENLYDKILEKINANQFYLNQNLKLSDLTGELGVTEKLISKAINTHAKENFNAFINRFRVKHATDLINSEKYSYYTIDAIAEESGFSNKVSFYKAFKRIETISPSKYRQNAQNGAKQGTDSLP